MPPASTIEVEKFRAFVSFVDSLVHESTKNGRADRSAQADKDRKHEQHDDHGNGSTHAPDPSNTVVVHCANATVLSTNRNTGNRARQHGGGPLGPTALPLAWFVGPGFDLDCATKRQRRNPDRRTSRPCVTKPGGIGFVELAERFHVDQET